MHGRSAISQHLMTYDQTSEPSPERPSQNKIASVFDVMNRAKGITSLFPGLDWVGQRVSKLSPEELNVIWEDFDVNHQA